MFCRFPFLKEIHYVGSQFVNIELGSVNDQSAIWQESGAKCCRCLA